MLGDLLVPLSVSGSVGSTLRLNHHSDKQIVEILTRRTQTGSWLRSFELKLNYLAGHVLEWFIVLYYSVYIFLYVFIATTSKEVNNLNNIYFIDRKDPLYPGFSPPQHSLQCTNLDVFRWLISMSQFDANPNKIWTIYSCSTPYCFRKRDSYRSTYSPVS